MNADDFPCKEETHAIIGCAFDVLNELGHGLNEKLYENSLVVEFKLRRIAFDQQRRFEVLYKGAHVGEFIPDLIAFGKVVVDAKCIDRIIDHERGQLLNYLRIIKLPVGLILNFKHAKLEWERIVLTAADQRQ
ncbi:MAG: GxxExxY protein [Verrucomicrobiota bacterium]